MRDDCCFQGGGGGGGGGEKKKNFFFFFFFFFLQADWGPRSRPTSGARSRGTTRASCRRSPKRSAPASRRSSTRCSPTAGRCGSGEAPHPHHRRQHLLGRPPGPELERTRTTRRSSPSAPSDPSCALERTEYVRVGTQHALLRRIVHAAEIDTVVDTRLIVDSTTAPAETAHEMNVLGTMNVLAACGGPDSPVTKVVFKSSAHYYGCERDDPSFFTEEMQRPHPPRTRHRGRHRRGRGRGAGVRRPQRQGDGHDAALLQRPRAGPADQPHRAARACRRFRASSASTRATSSSTRTTWSARCTTPSSTTRPASTTSRPTACSRCREIAGLLGKPLAPILPPWGTSLATRADQPDRRADPRRGPPAAALRARARQPQDQAVGLPLPADDAGDGAGVCGGTAPQTAAGERRGAISLRARSGGIPPLVAECSSTTSQAADATAACRTSRSAVAPPTICGLNAHSSPRSRCLRGLSRHRRGGRCVLLRRLQEEPDRRGREGQRSPDRRHDARRGGEEALRDAARPARPSGEGLLQGPHVHAVAEGGGDRDRHPRLGRQGAQALAGGRHVLPQLAQPAQPVAQPGAGGRGLLQQALDRQARQARAQVAGAQAGGRQGRPDEGLHRPARVQDRPAREVQHAGQGGRADAPGPGQHGDGRRSRRPSCSPRSRPRSWPRSTRRS